MSSKSKPSELAVKAANLIDRNTEANGEYYVQEAIDQACAEKDELHAMQLAAISTASGQNTESTVRERIGFDHPYCSTAYQDVCRAIDREMALRKACAEKDATIKTLCADWADDDTTVKKLAAPYIGNFDGARSLEERGLGFRGVVEVTEALVAKLAERDAEIARLQAALAGLTPEAIHNFCHDLDQRVSATEFAEACMQYQEKLYDGVCPTRTKIASLTEEIAQLKQDGGVIVKILANENHKLQEQNRSLRALLERVPHTCFRITESEYPGQTNLLHGGDDCPRCAYEKLKP